MLSIQFNQINQSILIVNRKFGIENEPRIETLIGQFYGPTYTQSHTRVEHQN